MEVEIGGRGGDRCGWGGYRYSMGLGLWVWLEMEMEMEMARFGWRGWVFLGFSGGGWSVVEVEIGVAVEFGVAMFLFQRWRCLDEFGFVFVVFFFYVDLYIYFLDLLGLIY